MQHWILFHRTTAEKIAEYQTQSAARRGMRSSNRNAGWKRISRSGDQIVEFELCQDVNDPARCSFGPYAIAVDRFSMFLNHRKPE